MDLPNPIDIAKSYSYNQGDEIKESCPVEASFYQFQEVEYGQFDRIKVTIDELDTPEEGCAPMYPNKGKFPPPFQVRKTEASVAKFYNLEVKEHATLNPRLDRILKARIPIRRGKDGCDYYEPHYQIHAAFFSAHCEYSLWFEGKNHGSIKVDYA